MIIDLPQFVPQETCLSCDGCCRFKERDSTWRPKMAREETEENGSGGKIFLKELDAKRYINTVECQGQVQCAFFHTLDCEMAESAENRFAGCRHERFSRAGGGICRVYEQRPFECRLYPFLLIKKNDGAAVGVHLSCPYIQEKWESTELKNHVDDLKQYFQKKDVLEFLLRNQFLFGEYSEYENEIGQFFIIEF